MNNKNKLPTGWKMVKFGEIADSLTVRVMPGEAETEYYVGLEHLDSESLKIRRWGSPDDVEAQKLRFWPGDIIFGKRRCYQRKLAVAEFEGMCSAHAMVLRAKEDNVDKNFLPFFLQSDMFMQRALDISVGSLSPTINWKTLKVQEFPLPPKEEQCRIAEILWTVERSIEKWKISVENIEESKRVIANDRFLLKEVAKRNPQLPKMLHKGHITELVEINPRVKNGVNDHTLVSFIKMEDVGEGGGFISTEDKCYKDVKNGFTNFENGDILFAKITPCMENNKGAIVDDLKNGLGFGSTEFFVLRPIKKEDTDFIYHLTMSYPYRIRAKSWMRGSAGQQRVPRDFFEQLPIAIPQEKERIEIGATFKMMDEKKAELISHIDGLTTLKKNLAETLLLPNVNKT